MDMHHEAEMESPNLLTEEEATVQKGNTLIRTCFLCLNALSGVGILSIPFALSQGGWLSLMVLFMVAAVCCYTGLLLQRCMEADPNIRTYPDIGNLAFGRKGRVAISAFVYVALYLVAVEFLILEGDNWHKIFPNEFFHLGRFKVEGKKAFVILAALVIMPTVWMRSFRFLAYVSLGGVVASIVLFFCVFWAGVADGVGFHEQGSLWRSKGLLTALSMYCFCYGGHATLPTICNSMENRARFKKVLLICFALCTMIYASMAIMGYLMFGENLTSQITLNLPIKNLSTKIAIYTTLINPFTKYAIVVAPIMTAIEHTSPVLGRRFLNLLIRTLLVISTAVVALILPFFAYVMAFIGALFSISLSMLFPCVCYMKIHKVYKRFGTELIVMIVIVVSGVCVSLIGIFISIKDIISSV